VETRVSVPAEFAIVYSLFFFLPRAERLHQDLSSTVLIFFFWPPESGVPCLLRHLDLAGLRLPCPDLVALP
jgi:hypothetical protein